MAAGQSPCVRAWAVA